MDRYAKMCGTKTRYPTEEMAIDAKIRMVKKEPTEKINAYFCEYCHHWHIGTDRNILPGMPLRENRALPNKK